MKKLVSIILLSLCALAVFTSCGKEKPLTAMQENARGIIKFANAGDYQALTDALPEELKASVPPETWETSFKPLIGGNSEYGAFISYLSVKESEKEIEGIGKVTAVFQKAEYENKKVVWQVEFAENGEMVNLFIRPA